MAEEPDDAQAIVESHSPIVEPDDDTKVVEMACMPKPNVDAEIVGTVNEPEIGRAHV